MQSNHKRRRRHRRSRFGKPIWIAIGAAASLGLVVLLAFLVDRHINQEAPAKAEAAATAGAEAPAARPLVPSADTALSDLASIGGWKGEYTADRAYPVGSMVVDDGQFYFAWKNGAKLGDGFEPVPEVKAERTVFSDDFSDGDGSLADLPRLLDGDLRWTVTGAGVRDAVAQPGFLTSAGNTYFVVNGLPGKITEFGSVATLSAESAVVTMALQRDGFGEMWHVNAYRDRTGDVTYWHAGKSAGVPKLIYAWSAPGGLAIDTPQEVTLKLRGNFMLGYLNGKLSFVHLSPMIGMLGGNATSIYVQNHGDVQGAEKQNKVWVKTRG